MHDAVQDRGMGLKLAPSIGFNMRALRFLLDTTQPPTLAEATPNTELGVCVASKQIK